MSSLSPGRPDDVPASDRPAGAPAPGALWRSIERYRAGTERKPPAQTSAGYPDESGMDRRQFLHTLGGSLALSGLGACSRPPQGVIVPYVRAPVGQVDGLPRYFATTLQRDGYGHGVLVESNMGRPTKIEGNPHHPASLGGTDVFDQAAVLQLWDPDRSQGVTRLGENSTWDAFEAQMASLRSHFGSNAGAGLHVLSGTVTSPTLAAQIAQLQARYPSAGWHVHQPAGNENAIAGARLAFGRNLSTHLQLQRAEVILAVDADFLSDAAAGLRYSRDFAAQRSPEARGGKMSRLYALEATPSLTGFMADHRLSLESHRIQRLMCELGVLLGVLGPSACDTPDPHHSQWLTALVADLRAQAGNAVIVIGKTQPPWMHALGHALNTKLRSAALVYTEPVAWLPAVHGDLTSLVDAMLSGAVDTLLVLDANPVYDAPAGLDFAAALNKVPHVLHLGLYRDETARAARWHLPLAHELEAWSDARAFDGTASLAQPLIAPLYGGRSAHELLAVVLGDELTDGGRLVRRHWQGVLSDDATWNEALQSGVIPDTALPALSPPLQPAFLTQLRSPPLDTRLEVLFREDPTVGDGRWANNSWLQELPKPLTQLTWDNPALVSPALAARESLVNGDYVELQLQGRTLRIPVWIMPGQPGGTVTLHLGYGRSHAGRLGSGAGFNAYLLRPSTAAWNVPGLTLTASSGRYPLASTQHHFEMDGRDLLRVDTLGDLSRTTEVGAAGRQPAAQPASLYPELPHGRYAWSMSIDLNACIGCKACTIACQAENNIPSVGKEQVQRGREMHWIRVDRYFEGAPQDPRSYSQPVPCMMCEHAPCELVCPVDATVHDSEGLNLQVYNRCVGTRFCSNNCPYKVRRFNFLQYVDENEETLKAQRNPEVSVRRRGVMEKCTYCIQRIEQAHILADREGRRIRDGEVLTACQAACPTRAIRFGDGADPHSDVSAARNSPRSYQLLAELNTRPRTSYLARVRNPNPALEKT